MSCNKYVTQAWTNELEEWAGKEREVSSSNNDPKNDVFSITKVK